MAAHGIKIDGRIHLPQGRTHLAFSVPKEAQGELLYLAAQLLSDKANLVRPKEQEIFASIKARRKESTGWFEVTGLFPVRPLKGY
jgi:hypothetical protein